MIKSLIAYNKKELSFKSLILSKKTPREKLISKFPFIYISLILIAFIIPTINEALLYISIGIFFFIVVDIFLATKYNLGFLNYLSKSYEKSNLIILNNYQNKKDQKFENFNKGFDIIRQKKILAFFKKNKIKKIDSDFILSSLRHKETIELTIFLIIIGAIMIGIITFLKSLINFYVPIENLFNLNKKVKHSIYSNEDIWYLKFQINILVYLFLGAVALVQILPYTLTNTLLNNRFKNLKELQRLIENIYLSKKK